MVVVPEWFRLGLVVEVHECMAVVHEWSKRGLAGEVQRQTGPNLAVVS